MNTFWNGKRVLIAGGGGFTGSWLCRELSEAGAEAIAFVKPTTPLDRLQSLAPNATVMHGDVLDYESVLKAMEGIDVVYNSAAIVYRETDPEAPPRTAAVSTVGAFHVGRAAKIQGVSKLVHISTPHIFGNLPATDLPMTETTIPIPEGVFSITKYAGDLVAMSFKDQDVPVVVTRGFSKYGPGQDADFFVAKVMTHLLQRKPLLLANPESTRDYTYVTDVVDGYMAAGEKGKPGELYHFGWGISTKACELYDLIVNIVRSELGFEPPPATWNSVYRAHDIEHQLGCLSKAENELGWKPTVSLEDGLKKTFDWWRQELKV